MTLLNTAIKNKRFSDSIYKLNKSKHLFKVVTGDWFSVLFEEKFIFAVTERTFGFIQRII